MPVVGATAKIEFKLGEADGYGSGGALRVEDPRVAWEILDASGRPTNAKGRADGVPVWGLPAAVVSGEGFTGMF